MYDNHRQGVEGDIKETLMSSDLLRENIFGSTLNTPPHPSPAQPWHNFSPAVFYCLLDLKKLLKSQR